ncbi:oligosaccharide flippase family protein [Priestia megaterium]|uniref:oligosaccharide flippase family protein n=1 Tax=Priestia megaterium TaxID=1404 RepID=UPI001C8E1FA9|nr:oligosaccharide flippase family protein [Priestia megaterium]MBY0196843.1 oligosaccharide flippase family protein [Priestia megaterium]
MSKLIKNRLLGNIVSLIILQGSNYVFPLLTFPYLVKILETNNYGVLVFCIAIMQFLNIFVDYGFNISATKEISINKNNLAKVNSIYNLVMTIKLALTVIIGLIYGILIAFLPFFHENMLAFLLSYLVLIGNVLFPIWLYQGLERMKYITYINVVVKVIVTALIFVFIKEKQDINLAVFLQSLYYFIPGIFSIFFVAKKFKIKYKLIKDIKKIKNELLKGKFVFMTNLWINFYSQGPLVIIGFISGNIAAGNYGIGQKIMVAFYGLSQPIVQAIYPYICEMYETHIEKFNLFKKKLMVVSTLFSFLISLMLFILSPQVTEFVAGKYTPQLIWLVRIFSIIIFISILNTIMARIMYAMNLQEILNRSYSKAAIIFVICAIPLTFWFQEYGMATIVMVVESIIFSLNIKNMFAFKEAHRAYNV